MRALQRLGTPIGLLLERHVLERCAFRANDFNWNVVYFRKLFSPQNEPQPHIMHIHLTNILLKRQGENVIQQSSNLLVSFLSIISSSFQSID